MKFAWPMLSCVDETKTHTAVEQLSGREVGKRSTRSIKKLNLLQLDRDLIRVE